MMRTHAAIALAGGLSLAFVGGPLLGLAPAAVARPGSATPHTTVTLTDGATLGMPDVLVAGWHTFTAVQKSKDAREFDIGKLAPGVTIAKVYALAKAGSGDGASATKAFIDLLQAVNIKGGVDTGKALRSSARTFETYLAPGNYATANLPDGNKPPVFEPFTVVAGSVGSSTKTTAAVTVHDFRFTLQGLKVGTTSVKFYNPSTQTHEIGIERIDPGHSQAEVLKALQGNSRPKFVHDDGFYGYLGPDVTMLSTLKFAPHTTYLFVCFLPDETMPKMYMPHAAEGMYKFFVTK